MRSQRVVLAGLAVLAACLGARTAAAQADRPQVAAPDTGIYARTPQELRPYARFVDPYKRFFLIELEYPGYGRHIPEPEHVETVKIGFVGPIIGSISESLGGPGEVTLRVNERQTRWDGYTASYLAPIGIKMLQGAQLAVRQANQRGGYRGRIPYELVVRNDNGNWRSSGREVIMLSYEDSVWAILGTVDGANTHIAIRAALKAEIPIMNTADTDPTLVETNIPWVFRNITDDRQMCYLLADFAFRRLGLERVAALRAVNRYGRMNMDEFRDAATRLGHPLVVELSYEEGDTVFTSHLERIRSLNVDGVVTYGNSRESALILKQMRERGMDQWFLGSDRMVTEEFIDIVGPNHGRVVAGYPYDPTSDDPRHTQFVRDFRAAYGTTPETYAAHAYDGAMMMIEAIELGGLNRALIRDELAAMKTYHGVTGLQEYDAVFSDRSAAALAVLESGRWEFYAEDELPAAEPPGVLDTPVEFGGWRGTTLSPTDVDEVRVGLFAPDSGAAPNGARLAIDELNAAGGVRGTPLRLVTRWDDDPWRGGAREMVRLVYDDSVWAVLGSENGHATHVAEQVVTKAWVPLVAPVSADPTLTYIRIPWMFRLPPDDAVQADVLVRDGVVARRLPDVGLITSSDHDGRTFAHEVLQRLNAAGAPPAFHFEVPPDGDPAALAARARSFAPGALIVRVPPSDMPDLLDRLWREGVHVPLLVPWIPGLTPSQLARRYAGDVLVVRPFRETGNPAYAAFHRAYRARYGSEPTPVAAYGYDAVRLVGHALGASGLNRPALRDALAAATGFVGATGVITWDNAGGNRGEPVLVVVPGRPAAHDARAPSVAVEARGDAPPR
ncbi:MAG: ABC transporter substrate-binding protein [Gemmatimonadales bacterium]|jgi:ABC-type branched-subunit amino acid transport system substrate-binding protein